MRCAACNHENRAGRKFCVECGAALALACPSCAAPYEAGEKFCGECGAALGTSAPRPPASTAKEETSSADSGARKVVTIVFADLVGSTALHERLDAESAQRVMDHYYAALCGVVDAHGGTVVKLLGDGVMAAFGLKLVAEDDALRAVRAASAMQDTFRALAFEAGGLRVAVNTGEVVVSGTRDDVIGDPVNVAARLQEQGGDGDVVVGEATRRLVATHVTLAPLGSVTLKGRTEAVAAYRLVSLDPPATVKAAPFVGRDDELMRLESVYGVAVRTPATRLAVLLGSPGLGKSRLIDEFARRHEEDATILDAHCDAAGGATFAPLAQAVRKLLGLDDGATGEPVRGAVTHALSNADDSERARIARGIDGLITGAPTSPEETFFVVRRFLAGLAATKPVVLVIDDIHWAEPLLLDLVEHLVQWGSGVPLFVLVGARPELRDLRSSLTTSGGLVADVVTLGGLDAGAAMRLAANVIGAADLPAAVAAKVLATTEGNPLFVGELVRMLVQEGALAKEGDRWTVGANLAAFEMPPTIHALLAARIERLRLEERVVLERASVVGRHFSRSAVAALLARDGSELDACLESLRRSELIERDTGWLLGEPALRFHHVLIRDAAYRRLLKNTRAELHARLADWIEARVGDAPEHDETIGWHLEQAHQHLRELGPLDAAGTALGERAARRLAAAGRRALARDDVSLAAGLLGRALDRLGLDAPERADLVLDWCEALLSAGDVVPAAVAIDDLGRLAAGSDRLRAWHTCFAGQLTVMTAPAELHAAAERVAAAARQLAARNDAAGEAKAHFVHAQALARLGKVGACEAALDQALAAARRAGDRRRANAVLAGAPMAALWGPSPVTRASGRCLDVVRVLRITQGAPAVEAVALSCQGVLEALRGRTEAARRMLASSRTMVEELGITHRLYLIDVFVGRVDLLEGDAVAAERRLRSAYDGLRDLGLRVDAAQAAALLARALLAQGRAAEAEQVSHESEHLAGDDLQAAIAWRGVRAEAVAARGEHAAAIDLAKSAVATAATTDALLDHAYARSSLAAAFHAAGRTSEGDNEWRRASELWEAKGATVLAERARKVGRGMTAQASAPTTESQAPAPVGARQASTTRAAVRVSAAIATPSGSVPRTKPARGRTSMPAPTTPQPGRVARHVRSNFATEQARRLDAAFAARDMKAVSAAWREDVRHVDRPHGATYGYAPMVERTRSTMEEATDATMVHEALATLGGHLALCRIHMTASGSTLYSSAAGASETDYLLVIEADEYARGVQIDLFLEHDLSGAIACLYQRYAELQPEGPACERASATARAIAAQTGLTPDLILTDFRALEASLAPNYESIDHRTLGTWTYRGSAAFLENLRGLKEVAEKILFRDEAILALAPSAALFKRMHSGTDRRGGGAYERFFLVLFVMGSDGRLARSEYFEADREAEALARFDAATRAPSEGAPRLRRVRTNAAVAAIAAGDAAVARHDLDAISGLFAEAYEEIHHPTASTYGRREALTSIELFLRSNGAAYRVEPLATLGDRLMLGRRQLRGRGTGRSLFDVAEYENETILLMEVDEQGLYRHCEVFALDRLRAAIGRLYERYAESLAEGRERTRSMRIARSVSTLDGRLDPDRIATGLAPAISCVDHRVFGTWSARCAEEWLTHWRAQAALAAGFTCRDDDILALTADAILVRQTYFGTNRTGGGSFENVILALTTFDSDGLFGAVEAFEPDQEAEALARFDVLTTRAPMRPVRRGVRPNAGLATMAAIEAAFARRDLDALEKLLGDPLETIEHPTGTTYGREGQLESSRRLMRLPDLAFRVKSLATLGDSLVLARRIVSASGTPGGRFDVGEYEIESIVVNEVDDAGRLRFSEVFSGDHLCQAIARLYARYAESLPDGAERTRAAGIAGSLSGFDGTLDSDRVASTVSPSFVQVDHRSLGTWSTHGREGLLKHWRLQTELAAGFSRRDDDILAFAPGANVTRSTYFGTNRASGGPFENLLLSVNVFDADGLHARCELFEPDREAEALARFDELLGGHLPLPVRRRLTANAATRAFKRFETAVAARDAEIVAQLLADPLRVVHHPTHTEYGRREMFGTWRSTLKAERVSFRVEILASLGDTLALDRHVVSVEGLSEAHLRGFGASEFDEISLLEVDDQGRFLLSEIFAPEHAEKAVIRLYERYAELRPEGPERERATAMVQLVRAVLGPIDRDRIGAILGQKLDFRDHRRLGLPSSSDREDYLRSLGSLFEAADDLANRLDDVLALAPTAFVFRFANCGTDRNSGGAFERPMCFLAACGADGRASHWELFDADRETDALARFDDLTGNLGDVAKKRPWFSNAATRLKERLAEAWEERNWERVAALHHENCRFEDRRRFMGIEGGVDLTLAGIRVYFDAPHSRVVVMPIATRGGRLSLSRVLFEGGVDVEGGGDLAIDLLCVDEVGADGRSVAIVTFDSDDLDAAYAELDRCYEAGEGEGYPSFGEFTRALANRDWAAVAAFFPPNFVEHDRRALALSGRVEGSDAWSQHRALVELAPDTIMRADHVRHCTRGVFCQVTWQGSREGGRYEIPFVSVTEFDERRAPKCTQVYDPEQIDRALARFAELKAGTPDGLRPDPLRIPPNAVTRAYDRWEAAARANDLNAVRAVYAPEFELDDRRFHLAVDREMELVSARLFIEQGWRLTTPTLLATAGDRLALHRVVVVLGSEGDRSEVEVLAVDEVDGEGRFVRSVQFDPSDRPAASAELLERWIASGAGGAPAAINDYIPAVNAHDIDRLRALLADDLIYEDHRRTGIGRLDGVDAYLASIRVWWDACQEWHGEQLRSVIASPHGGVGIVRTWGKNLEGGEFESVLAGINFVEDGRIARLEVFEPEDLDVAVARFDELSRASAAEPSAQPFENTASATNARVIAALIAHDWPRFAAHFPPNFRMSDRRRVVQLELGLDQYVAFTRELADGRTTRNQFELLATRGELLALTRNIYEFTDADVGPSEIAFLILTEADGRGRIVAYVRWDVDDLDAAYAELDRRWDAGEAAEHPRASKWLADYLRAFAARDWTAMTALFAPDLVGENHRLVGWGTRHGPEGIVSTLQAQIELAPDTRERVDHVRTCDRGVLFEYAWHGTREGGAFENLWVVLVELARDGTARRADVWQPEQIDQALARFGELATGSAPQFPFANAATRAVDRGAAALAAGDWDAFAALMAPGFRHYDRTRIAQLEADGKEWLASFRQFVEMAAEPSYQLLATRGERLALFRMLWRGAGGDVGPSEIDWRLIVEVNDRGEHTAIVVYDPEDLDAAYAELDARYEGSGEHPRSWASMRTFVRAVASKDFGAIVAMCANSMVEYDHRSLAVIGTSRGAEVWTQNFRTLVDLAPDTIYRVDHYRAGARGYYSHGTWHGTREGGPYEIPVYAVIELDDSGLIVRADIYDDGGVEAALARFAEIDAGTGRDPVASIAKPNMATAAIERMHSQRIWDVGPDAGKLDALRGLCAPGMIFEDRRRLALISGDVELLIAAARERQAMGARPDSRIFGTAGERVAIDRVLWSGGPSDGRFEIEYLRVMEVDEAGLFTAIIMFDLDDARAAQREAWARWAAIEPDVAPSLALLARVQDAFNAQDIGAYSDTLADDVVVVDHRRTGMGRVEGIAAYVSATKALWDLAPGTIVDLGWCWPAWDKHGVVTVVRRHGVLADGGDYESEYLGLFVRARDRVTNFELFELDDLDAALTRFEELRPDPLRIPPNAATRTADRVWEAIRLRGLDAIAALHDPSYTFDDRRKLMRMTGDRESAIGNARFAIDNGWSATPTLLATAGDRLALYRLRLTSGEPGAESEVELLMASEVNEDGRFVRSVAFDPDDRAAASTELLERYVATNAGKVSPGAVAALRVWNSHDLEALRAFLPPDFYLDDHRRTGVGRLASADAYLASLTAMWELSPDLRTETLYVVSAAAHGTLYVSRWYGTNTEGGEFDSVYVCIGLQKGDRPVGLEVFELDDLEAARTRFEELRPDPLRIPPNAATQAGGRYWKALRGKDLDTLDALYAPSYAYDDRRSAMLMTGDRDATLHSNRLVLEAAWDATATLLATAGDRLALYRILWVGGEKDAEAEVEMLVLDEVDGDGLFVRTVLFDPDDSAAASMELFERYLAINGSSAAGLAFGRAFNEHDLDRLRAMLPADFYLDDHRRTGVGRLDADGYLASLAALWELSRDVRYETLYIVSEAEHGTLFVSRWFGTNAEGGEFEAVYVCIALRRGDDTAGLEMFELDDMDVARERFEDLGKAPKPRAKKGRRASPRKTRA